MAKRTADIIRQKRNQCYTACDRVCRECSRKTDGRRGCGTALSEKREKRCSVSEIVVRLLRKFIRSALWKASLSHIHDLKSFGRGFRLAKSKDAQSYRLIFVFAFAYGIKNDLGG